MNIRTMPVPNTKTGSRLVNLAVLGMAGLALAGCNTMDRLSSVGREPALSAIQSPTTQPGYRAVQMPMPTPQATTSTPNSLWRSGARTFFKDQRAMRIGDLLTVKVKITDSAKISNQTERSRKNSESMGMTNLFGLEKPLTSAGVDPANLVNTGSNNSSAGAGSVNRSEQLVTNIAAVINQVLPNGNLVIEGRQEVRINAEIRELIVAGVVRPEDIEADNTIDSTKIAEARISYGGRGQISDVQQPRYGQQALDVLLPF